MIRYPAFKSEVSGTLLQPGNFPYAKYKHAPYVADKRTIFLTENMLIFAIKGRKTLYFKEEVMNVDENSIVLLKRGIYVLNEFVDEGELYEALLLFIPDHIVSNLLRQQQLLPDTKITDSPDCIVLPSNDMLLAFKLQYMQFFRHRSDHLEALLQLKLQELLLLLLAGESKNKVLPFLQGITHAQPANIDYIVNTYLFSPVTLEELARLSGRSLATFKRDFQQQYHTSPRKWINDQRLEHARTLLFNTDKNVNEVAMDCCFENVPHFIRIFKQKFGDTPHSLRAKKAIL